MNLRYSFAFTILMLPPSAHAEAPSPVASASGSTITVVATGSDLRVDQAGQSISVMGADELASIQGPDLSRALERLPGVTLTRNGGLGSFTGVRVRGAAAEQLLVLVDGVRVADVAAPGGGYDFGNLTAGGIGKIELLRGSNSVIWGSDAIGGVLAVTTRTVNGIEASAEYGAHDTFDGQASVGHVTDRYELGLTGGYTRTSGISQAASGTEPDGFRQWRIAGRGKVALTDGLSLVANGRYADSRLDIDGYPPPFYAFADTAEYQKTREGSGRAGFEYDATGLTLRGGVALASTRRWYFDPTYGTAPNYNTYGRSIRADFTGRVQLPSRFAVDFGADSEWSKFSDTYDPQRKARLSSGHALLGWYGDRLMLAGGVRVDDHDRFGTHWTFGANGAYLIAGDWRVRASYGEGFKAPTLFQLYSSFGNQTLQPERSRSYDAGIEKGDRNSGLHFAATVFRRDSRDLIDYVACPLGFFCIQNGFYNHYQNVGRARAEGVELEADARPSDRLTLHAAYSYVKASDLATGRDLARRPRNAVTVAADWRSPLHDLTIGADVRLVSDSYDDPGNFTRLDGYALFGLRASLPVTPGIELYGSIENLANERYQTAAGYGTYGRSAYAGVRARF
ncbi:MAG: TonB-dependent receptor [Novosphingobium sp.]|nr:TonB-dependent receptor [Novosphingobium sp.]